MPTITPDRAGGLAVCDFLDLIAWSEGADYNTIVSGPEGPETFSDFSDHPFADRPPKLVRLATVNANAIYSTASGRYQLLYRFWKPYKASLNLPDFSPLSQDLVALEQISERHAIGLIQNGDIQGAITACSNIWASFPGNDFGQGGHSMDRLLAQFATIEATENS